ncbi:MAG: NusA-like transcription termination signal-binding factor [Thermoprotei archaeon]|nr:MAG: NusA-like transcription termination signal-binding factor [Thermoprotei archaeon]
MPREDKDMSVKITLSELRYMTLFQDLTGAVPKDCIVDNERNTIIFVVGPGEAGIAIGRRGVNVKHLSRLLGKNIEVVEWADNLEDFVKNIFMPARVLKVRLVTTPRGRKTVFVTVDPKDKGLAIGRNGKNVAKARLLLKRYHGIDNVVIV